MKKAIYYVIPVIIIALPIIGFGSIFNTQNNPSIKTTITKMDTKTIILLAGMGTSPSRG